MMRNFNNLITGFGLDVYLKWGRCGEGAAIADPHLPGEISRFSAENLASPEKIARRGTKTWQIRSSDMGYIRLTNTAVSSSSRQRRAPCEDTLSEKSKFVWAHLLVLLSVEKNEIRSNWYCC